MVVDLGDGVGLSVRERERKGEESRALALGRRYASVCGGVGGRGRVHVFEGALVRFPGHVSLYVHNILYLLTFPLLFLWHNLLSCVSISMFQHQFTHEEKQRTERCFKKDKLKKKHTNAMR